MSLQWVLLVLAIAGRNPLEVVKDANSEVQQVLKEPNPTVQKLATKADAFVDFGELTKRALGKEWEKMPRKKQQEFASTMKGVIRASYAQKALNQGTANVNYEGHTVNGNEAEVPTTIAVKNDKFPVAYRLYRANPKAGWRIYDIVTDEVSLVETYRGQFRKIINEKGVDGLLNTLKSKKEQLEKGGTSSQAQN